MNFDHQKNIARLVEFALEEDIGTGDITAQLIPENTTARAQVITREKATLCGTEWVDAVFATVSKEVKIEWAFKDGDQVQANDILFSLTGPARAILTGERSALNFLQTLSGTATTSRHYANLVAHTGVKLLDTRKTLPGLRLAQKYAVKCGGCYNHRIGLFDAFLIKENHIMACGSITEAIVSARKISTSKPVEVEVESLEELDQALKAKADIIMLDNFSLDMLKTAVSETAGKAKLEASGGITHESLIPIAETGVDFISIGALTKDCQSIDLSMRIQL
jgi:nicotinate-nucleotide pyrophosphorylase (carboxylating)